VGQRRGEKKKHLGQGGCSSAKRAERAHPQLVHWWLLVHSSPYPAFCKPHSLQQNFSYIPTRSYSLYINPNFIF
jgi:hypothetical protein